MCEFKVSVRTGNAHEEEKARSRMRNMPHKKGEVMCANGFVSVVVDHPTLNRHVDAAGWARNVLPFFHEMAPSVSMAV